MQPNRPELKEIKGFSQEALAVLSLGTSYYRTLGINISKHRERALRFDMNSNSVPHISTSFSFLHSIAVLRHYLKVFGVHLMGVEQGYDFYKRAITLADLNPQATHLVTVHPWVIQEKVKVKFERRLEMVEHDLQVGISALTCMSGNMPHNDILIQLNEPNIEVLCNFGPDRNFAVSNLLKNTLKDLTPEEALSISELVAEEARTRARSR